MIVRGTSALAAAALGAVLLGASAAGADEPPRLWDPSVAVGFLLDESPPADTQPDEAAPRSWDGSLGAGIVRVLFGTYRTVLSSQDLPVCGFSPSCSRFSQRAIARCGFLEGALLSLDRMIRDHPLAVGRYPTEPGGRLLRDEPERYCLAAPR